MNPGPAAELPIVYWRPGCPYCVTLKLRLRMARIPFEAVNIWRDSDAADLVKTHNGGNELVPMVQIGSTVLSNPGMGHIRRLLGTRHR